MSTTSGSGSPPTTPVLKNFIINSLQKTLVYINVLFIAVIFGFILYNITQVNPNILPVCKNTQKPHCISINRENKKTSCVHTDPINFAQQPYNCLLDKIKNFKSKYTYQQIFYSISIVLLLIQIMYYTIIYFKKQ